MGMKEVGTLKELGVKVGDVVEWLGDYMRERDYVEYTIGSFDGKVYRATGMPEYQNLSQDDPFRIISRASDNQKTWGEMTPEEKGALLLANHDGKSIEVYDCDTGCWREVRPEWVYCKSYRVKQEPKVETVTRDIWMDRLGWLYEGITCHHPVRVTFNTIDGVIDVNTYKVEPR